MTNLKPVLAVCGLILAASACFIGFDAYRSGLLPFILSPLQSACRSMLEERLKAPATLRIITAEQFEEPVAAGDLEAVLRRAEANRGGSESVVAFNLQVAKENLAKGGSGPVIYHVYLTSDAANSFGTPLRSISHCSIVSDWGEYPEPYVVKSNMKLDGFDRHEWLLERGKNLRD